MSLRMSNYFYIQNFAGIIGALEHATKLEEVYWPLPDWFVYKEYHGSVYGTFRSETYQFSSGQNVI
jgi:hypothetical protein